MDLPVLAFESADAWGAWLVQEHATSEGVWLKIAKKGSGIATVSYSDTLDVALCHGWIDGQKGRLDEEYWLQRFTPRRARSRWSKINCARAGALIEQGRMRPAGLAEVERAKQDGRWEAAYAGQREIETPPDLLRALAADPRAQAAFDALKGSERYSVLYHVHDAKRPETRARRIAQYVEKLAAGRDIRS